MHAPILATSLGDFWGRRWNLAFRDLAHSYIFRPLIRRTGPAAATLAAFVASGVIHDAVISIPARGGYGLPTLYFSIQGVAVLIERRGGHGSVGLRVGRRRARVGGERRVPRGRADVGIGPARRERAGDRKRSERKEREASEKQTRPSFATALDYQNPLLT